MAYGNFESVESFNNEYDPTSILEFSNAVQIGKVHPTQKPVELMEYLVKTYTNEGDTVLDFTMGSGSTGVACVNTSRNFISIELDQTYFNIAFNRIEEARVKSKKLFQ
jgi:site-specific DNA-methyltransferase (adenine-specific)